MSVVEVMRLALEVAPAVAGAVAAAFSISSVRTAHKAKKTLEKFAVRDPSVTSQFVKAFQDRDLSDAEVSELVRVLQAAIERDLLEATGDRRESLKRASALASEEAQTRDHRLFKELAVRATESLEPAA
jgi:hypothetical protein